MRSPNLTVKPLKKQKKLKIAVQPPRCLHIGSNILEPVVAILRIFVLRNEDTLMSGCNKLNQRHHQDLCTRIPPNAPCQPWNQLTTTWSYMSYMQRQTVTAPTMSNLVPTRPCILALANTSLDDLEVGARALQHNATQEIFWSDDD